MKKQAETGNDANAIFKIGDDTLGIVQEILNRRKISIEAIYDYYTIEYRIMIPCGFHEHKEVITSDFKEKIVRNTLTAWEIDLLKFHQDHFKKYYYDANSKF
ncbi:hypothetical protein A2619_01090 [candidate division WWE3 bacterium RIFOXYD1_FULL_39_9]|uniref:Uncharacterized protein n=1 Tax=candidate division WWE3 bacterium RIFOXYD1_FULL_39_9 TaxID=1802649 RepID=A0A1F4X6K7_UNCKA|nr:MAG: hypothetical protein A2619_01090 [candidate division WWE3 bacterium RIFOXYD1_FULL_39_9]